MVKQKAGSKECGACVVAMLTDRTKDEILDGLPDVEKPDHFWLNHMHALGFVLEDVRDDRDFNGSFAWEGMFNGYLSLPLGSRYYCSIGTPQAVHAVAIDEAGMVFDPSTSAPILGTCKLGDYLRLNRKTFGTIAIRCCYRIRGPSEYRIGSDRELQE